MCIRDRCGGCKSGEVGNVVDHAQSKTTTTAYMCVCVLSIECGQTKNITNLYNSTTNIHRVCICGLHPTSPATPSHMLISFVYIKAEFGSCSFVLFFPPYLTIFFAELPRFRFSPKVVEGSSYASGKTYSSCWCCDGGGCV
eukprot:TRINITY_DN7601_c0_g2_i3.p2 TRINITY_DN7601_c0_g2~~TRINITY_DN7601_c0_g2_i3.p2  ORF type:complete len:141 (+),score=2.40 TRINITY_DN7601_c0_g2_i3:151-573(+)